MKARRTLAWGLAGLALIAAAGPARAVTDLASDVSSRLIEITSNFSGASLLIFGYARSGLEREGTDLVIVIRGPAAETTVRRKERVAGIWVNRSEVTFSGVPDVYAMASTRALDDATRAFFRQVHGLGTENLRPEVGAATEGADLEAFRAALIRRKMEADLFQDRPGAVQVVKDGLFRAEIDLPATVPVGQYAVDVYLFANGALVTRETSYFAVDKSGIERSLFNLAHEQPLLYGLSAITLALILGWLASALFRRP